MSAVRDKRRSCPSHTAAFKVTDAPSTVWGSPMTVPMRLTISSETSGALGSIQIVGNHWANCPVTTATAQAERSSSAAAMAITRQSSRRLRRGPAASRRRIQPQGSARSRIRSRR